MSPDSRNTCFQGCVPLTWDPYHLTAAAPDLSTGQALLARERDLRERWRGSSPDDPERRQALTELDADLRDTIDSLTAYVRRGPQIGRAISTDPVRVTQRDLRAARKRIRSALNRTSGTPTPPVKRPTTKAIWGSVSRFKQELYEIDRDHEAMVRALGRGKLISAPKGGYLRSVRDLNAEAEELLDRLRTARHRVLRQIGRYRRRRFYSYEQQDQAAKVEAELSDILRYADSLAADLRASVARRGPVSSRPERGAGDLGRRQPPWDPIEAVEALDKFIEAHDRLPTARELGSRGELPHYTTLCRLFGRSPLTYLESKLVDQEAAPKAVIL
jgi:hypothetical protein